MLKQWIEVKARYDKMLENGATKKVTEPYLVKALSCTEAEARVIEEITPYLSGDCHITSCTTTKIAEVMRSDELDERFYKVKVNFITIDERTATEKRTASYIVVEAPDFRNALENFIDGMKGTMADFEIEAIAETAIIDVFDVKEVTDA